MRDAPNIMPPRPTTAESDFDDMAVKIESSHQ